MTDAHLTLADPALGFSYQVVLDKDARRTIVFQAHVTNSTPVEGIHELLDKMGKAADRQIAIYELHQAQLDLEGQKRTAQSLAAQMETMEQLAQARYEASGRKGDWDPEKMPTQEKQARGSLKVSLERYREGIEKAEQTILRCKGLVNGYGAHSGSDRHAGHPGG